MTGSAVLLARLGSGSKLVSITVTAGVTTSLVSCQSPAIAGGDSTKCNITLSKAAPSGGLRLGLQASSKNLRIPLTVLVLENQTSVQFRADASVPDHDENVTLSANSDTESSATTISLRTIKPVALSCEPKYIQAGKSAICELQLNTTSISDSLAFNLSSSFAGLKLPAQVGTRTGQRRIRFEATVDSAASPGTAVIEASLSNTTVRENLAVLSPGVLSLSVPDQLVGQPGLPLHFTAVSRDGQNLPIAVSVSGLPALAVFDAQTGEFEWLPSESDLGRHAVTFAATNAVGAATRKTMTIDIGLGLPRLASLRNGSGTSASAACSPGSVATVVGRFLSGSDLTVSAPVADASVVRRTRVLVNGDDATVLSSAKDTVDFVCPMAAPGTPLEIAVETESGVSNRIQTRMADIAPGIFTVDGSGSGQAIAWRTGSPDLALIPNYRFMGKPALSGDQISVLVTGIKCDENFASPQPLMNLGNTSVPIDSLTASAQKAGACEIGITIPEGIYGDALPLTLDVPGSDGRTSTSNIASIAVDNPR
jgi:uncharacterized protein (TIGR03437 family)